MKSSDMGTLLHADNEQLIYLAQTILMGQSKIDQQLKELEQSIKNIEQALRSDPWTQGHDGYSDEFDSYPF
jgi:hypothetical protein